MFFCRLLRAMASVNHFSKPTIGTHNGKFHADELVACAMLRQLPEYNKAKIVRTRDASQLATCTTVVDVGGLFDPNTHRFDHHQRGFELTFKDFFKESNWDIKLSSAGLIYVHYGHRVIAGVTDVQESDPMVSVLFQKIYSAFVVEIDAIDNGVAISDNETRYSINTGLSSRVARLNPKWNDPDADETACFMKALQMVEEEFVTLVAHYAKSWYPARALVSKALSQRHQVDPSGHIISLEDEPCPWADHFHELEKLELEKLPNGNFDVSDLSATTSRPVFCLYRRDDGQWSVQTISTSEKEHFKSRVPLPEAWRGLRDEELSRVVGLPGCVFVHATGFLGIHKTRDGALYMARTSLKLANLIDV
ncbi:hypothetical protein CRM22_005355 [Opisthorchis felineus]|uniref:Metal-dependent protein hydrolase n=1 Tax=Opisthorchis felineus TaxID=147828 RepID=A0A4S2LX87_OPIFE|nr:hypothetical protein CRM22_005355 [Opisthorchis felineus]